MLGDLGFTEIRQSDLLRRLAGASDMVGLSLQTANTAWAQNTALQDEAGKRFATFQSQLTVFWNRLTDIGITLGTALMPLLTSFLNILNFIMPAIEFLANSFAAMPLPLQIMAVGVAGLVAAIGPLLLIAGQLAMGLAALIGVGGFAGLMTAMTTVATFVTGGLTAAFTAILPFLGPIGLIAVGVGAVVLAWKYWDQIVAFFAGAWQTVKAQLLAIPDILLPMLGPIGLVVATFKHWDQIAAIAQAVYTAVKTWLIDKFNAIVESIRQKVAAVTGFFRDMYIKVVGQSYVPDMVSGIGYEFGRLDDVMVNPASRSTSLVQDTFRAMSDAVSGLVSDMLRKVSSALTGWLDGFMPSWAANLVGGIADTVMSGVMGKFLGTGGGGGLLGGSAGGGLLGKIPGLSGLLGGGGGGLFASGGGLASGAAINATTAGLAGGGAGAGAGAGGMGATLTSLLTMPITIGVGAGLALTWAIWKKGLFRGGEEALKVSPRRDMFLRQFGDPANKDVGGGGWNLASALVKAGAGDGGGPLFRAFQQADTVAKFESAQSSIVALLKRTGMEVHSFAQGGFIPPGVVTPAMLHGGSQGEIIAPLEKVMNSAMTINWVVNAWDASGVRTAMPALIRELKLAMLLNQDGIMTANRRALEA